MKVDQEKIRVGVEKINAQRMMWRGDVQPAVRFFDYLVVIDFEATCIGRDNDEFCQEIIQFPAVLVDVKTMSIKDEFCQYVKPIVNPKLSDYCTNLTGITQDLVENAMEFEQALRRFEEWMLSHELGLSYKFTIVTDGCYDMGRFLYKQCQLSNVKYPIWAHRWMNIRKSFCLFYHLRWFNLRLMVEMLGQKFIGTPHNGKDDALNIAKIVICLLQDGSEALENEKILLDDEEQQKNAEEISKDPRIWFGLSTVQNLTRQEFLNVYKSEHGIPKHCKSAFINHNTSSSYNSHNSNMGKENVNNNNNMNIMDFALLCNNNNSPPKSQHDYLISGAGHRMFPLPQAAGCGCSPSTFSSTHPLPPCVHSLVHRMPADHHSPPFLVPPHQLYLPHVHFHSRGGDSPRHQNSRNHLSDHYINVSGQEQFSPPPKAKRPPGLLRRAFESQLATAGES